MQRTANITLSVPQWDTILDALQFTRDSDRDALERERRRARDPDFTAELQAAVTAQDEIISTIRDVLGRGK